MLYYTILRGEVPCMLYSIPQGAPVRSPAARPPDNYAMVVHDT